MSSIAGAAEPPPNHHMLVSNLFGYVPYPDYVLEGFYKEAIANGLNVMRIFDALNDIDNVRGFCVSLSYVAKIEYIFCNMENFPQ